MTLNTKASSLFISAAALAAVAMAAIATPGAAADAPHIERQQWTFDGPMGQLDRAQLQRGFQVYQNVCSACHGLSRLSWRNLVQPGGPEFPE